MAYLNFLKNFPTKLNRITDRRFFFLHAADKYNASTECTFNSPNFDLLCVKCTYSTHNPGTRMLWLL